MNSRIFLLLLFLGALCNSKLFQTVALISHGARYHTNDLYDGGETKSLWGQLTPVGLRQQEVLGKYVRKDYIENVDFLPTKYVKGTIEVYSTTANRSMISALAMWNGIYPLGNGPKLIYVDRPYHLPPYSNISDSTEQNFALPKGGNIMVVKLNSTLMLQDCQNYNVEVQKNIRQAIQEYKQMNITYQPFLKKLSVIFDIDPQTINFTKANDLYDTLKVDKYIGKSLPTDLSTADFDNLEHLHNWYTHFTINHNLSKAFTSNKMLKVLSDFDNRIKNPSSTLQWTTLSADEVDIVSAQINLNISSSQCIQDLYRKGSYSTLNCQGETLFASSIFIELHSDNEKDFYVKIRNNGKYVYLCQAKQFTCNYSDWKTRIKKDILPNVESVCGKPKSPSYNVIISQQ